MRRLYTARKIVEEEKNTIKTKLFKFRQNVSYLHHNITNNITITFTQNVKNIREKQRRAQDKIQDMTLIS